jgi:hypothetical protein
LVPSFHSEVLSKKHQKPATENNNTDMEIPRMGSGNMVLSNEKQINVKLITSNQLL